MTLDKKGIQNAIKFGMSREEIAKKYGLDSIEEAEMPIEEPEAEKTESEQLEEERNKLETYIKDTELKLERQTTDLADLEKAQNTTLEEIATLRKELKSKCVEYESFVEKAATATSLLTKTESELNEAMEKLKEIDTKIMSITKISITVDTANEITSETELDFTDYETIFIDLVQSGNLMDVSVSNVITFAKLISAIKKIGKEKVILKFESKKLKELYEKISN